MKLRREPIDVDLYVEHKPLSEKEMKETIDFIENYRKKRKFSTKKARTRRKHKVLA
jgi:hypothetical protein